MWKINRTGGGKSPGGPLPRLTEPAVRREIAEIIRHTMEAHSPKEIESLEDALDADRWAREKAESLVHALPR